MRADDGHRVLFVTSNFPRWVGDSTTPFILHLAQDLSALGWSVDVLAPHAPAAALTETLGDVRVERFRYLWPGTWQTVCYEGGALANLERRPANLLKLPFLVGAEWHAVDARLASHRYALAHSHWILPQGFTTALAARVRRVPHLLTVHGSDVLSLKGPLLRPFKRAALRGADAVTVNSSATEREVHRLGVPLPVLERIPMGVAEPVADGARRERAAAIRARHRRGDGPLLLFVGRLAEEKGWRDLVAAVALLRDGGGDASLLMLGEGPDRAQVQHMVASLGLGDRVQLGGWVEHAEIPAYLEAADLFVAPSCTTASGRSEAQGLALAEAMMYARPVLTTRVGGIGDSVHHDLTGWIVDQRDPRALADAVRRLHAEPELAQRLGSEARLHASRHLSRARTAQAFDALYRRLVQPTRGAAVAGRRREAVEAGHRAAVADERRPRVLVLRHRAAPDAVYGGPVYTASILRLLSGAPLDAAIHELSFETQPAPASHRLRNLAAMARALVSSLPAKVLRFRSPAFARRVRLARDVGAFDLVVISGLEMLWCRSLLAGTAPVVYLCHNLEGELSRRQAARWQGLPLLSALAQRDAERLAGFERREVARADALIAISEGDRAALAGIAPDVPGITLPPTFGYPRWQRGDTAATGDRAPIRLGFLGNLGWWPNRTALDWFLDAVWPRVHAQVELHLFGSGSDRLPPRSRVVGHGYVPDLASVWDTAQIMIQPIVVAAGLNIKVAEAVYNRRPIIATPVALAGCGLAADPAIVVADGAAAWVEFLNGPGVPELADREVALANADRFAAPRQGERLAAFVRGLGAPRASAVAARAGGR